MILVELGETSWRRHNYDEQYYDANLRIECNLVHEIQEEVQVREEVARSREIVFCKGDLV